MKKILLMLFIIIIVVSLPVHVKSAENNSYKSAVLIDYKSGKVLYENNKDQVLPEASITKLMTYYVIKDYLKSSNINEKTIIKIDTDNFISQDDASGIGLKKGQSISISDLIASMLIVSANDSAMALENFYNANGGNFVDAMNKKALELGLKNTVFVNPTGLTINDKANKLNTTSAYDIAILAKNIINDYPGIFKITSMDSFTIDGKTYLNTNGTLKFNNRVDGLKSGHTKEAGYCLVSTENIRGSGLKSNSSIKNTITDDMRIISVVLGCETEEQRIQESLKLLDYGEKNYKYELILSQNDKFRFENEMYGSGYIEASPDKELFLLKNKNEKLEINLIMNQSLTGKIKKGSLVGKAVIKSKTSMLTYSANLYALDNYTQINIFKRIYVFIKHLSEAFIYKLKLYF